MCEIIYLKPETYQKIKFYFEKLYLQDKLAKSFDDRLLDLLLKYAKFSVYRSLYKHLSIIYKSNPFTNAIPFNLREQTLESLRIYCFINDIRELDTGILNLIKIDSEEREINDLHESLKKLQSSMKTQLLMRVKN